ncbi:MAG: hypothetical protein ACP5QK_01375, partial [Myxococcota bacterium]
PYPSGSQPNTPNWYYYWTQTSANVYNPHLYSTTVGCNNICGQSEPGVITYGCFRRSEPNQFYICDPAGEDIDTFATTNIHEGTHMINWQTWWPNGYDSSNDNDGDMIPNDIEPSYGLNPNSPNTISDDFDDFDYLSYLAEEEWISGSANKEDWAYPGNQWR